MASQFAFRWASAKRNARAISDGEPKTPREASFHDAEPKTLRFVERQRNETREPSFTMAS